MDVVKVAGVVALIGFAAIIFLIVIKLIQL